MVAVPAFIGFTEKAPDDYVDGTPFKVTSWTQYFEAFGGFPKDNSAYLPYSVQGWFQNGGGTPPVFTEFPLTNLVDFPRRRWNV